MSARGRPRGFDRDAALDAAMHLFWRKGFSATSVADLCAAMGIASPSLYAAFGSKEALYAEAIARYGDLYGPLIWTPMEQGETARASIEGFLMASAATLPACDNPGGCMVTLSTAREEGCGGLADLIARTRAKAMEGILARLERGVAAGELPPSLDLAAIARFYLSVQQGMAVQARDGAGRRELESVARAAMTAWEPLVGAPAQPSAASSSVTGA
ncbi:TetR/AcrR family transcriptional regulator [Muricoccus radiodurans]|uniref:TetR/AcrR family transcriptional regulator n=1 Tax=Muricoccus radiodurans TaxID=2231721 RepID=UPI003CE88688